MATEVSPCWCGYQPTSARDQFLHDANEHTRAGQVVGPDGWATSRPSARPPKQERVKGRKISEVGQRTAGGLACPVCGGTSYKPKRSKKAKIGLGFVGAMAFKASQVACVTCGTVYKRG